MQRLVDRVVARAAQPEQQRVRGHGPRIPVATFVFIERVAHPAVVAIPAGAHHIEPAAYAAVLIAAFRGHEVEAREFIAAAAKDFAARGDIPAVKLWRVTRAGRGPFTRSRIA